MKIKVLPAGECADFVVCLRVGSHSPFKDNVRDVCSHCGHAVFFRPYMPKEPARLCVQCAIDLAEGGHA